MAVETTGLAPVRGRARIEVLDILRGIAILGIFYMNIPYMGNNGTLEEYDQRLIGWTLADRTVWAAIQIYWEGTQRGLLEFLFGAGAMVLTAKVMTPDGPVAVADLFYRRNLWLIAFGLLDIFLITWIGDILLAYGLAAMFIFPFRKLAARTLIILGLLFASATAIGIVGGGGVIEYASRAQLVQEAQTVQAKVEAKQALGKDDKATQAAWRKKLDRFKKIDPETKAEADKESKAHHVGPWAYAQWAWGLWHAIFIVGNGTFSTVIEAICGMFLGMAFWKMGIIQGQRSKRFYASLALAAYGFGMTARAVGVHEILQFAPQPKTIWMTNEFARLAVSLGHLALVNLLVQTRFGKSMLSPFRAAGQTAFSLYILTSILGLWIIFAPWGLGLWGKYSWAGMATIATIVVIALLILANIWVRYFVSGPLEWLWRSLSYWQRQPFVRHRGQPTAPAEPGMEIKPLSSV